MGPEACINNFELMLDQIDTAQEQGYSVCYTEDLFYIKVWENQNFYDLYEADSPIQIPQEVRERISAIFNRLTRWEDLQLDWPKSFEVEIDGASKEDAPSIAWAHKQTFDNTANAVACLILPGGRQSGCFNVIVEETKTLLWFVDGATNYAKYFRWLIIKTTHHSKQMQDFAPSAFPYIDFVPNAFNGINKMSKPYNQLVEHLVHHLGVLSDHGKRIFSKTPWAEVTAEFGSYGVSVSDENGKTKANHVARNERTKTIDGSEVIFWWHSKLEPHRDRIHFYPDGVRDGGQILVGIFCKHLTT